MKLSDTLTQLKNKPMYLANEEDLYFLKLLPKNEDISDIIINWDVWDVFNEIMDVLALSRIGNWYTAEKNPVEFLHFVDAMIDKLSDMDSGDARIDSLIAIREHFTFPDKYSL